MDNDGSSSVYSGTSNRTPVSRVVRAGTSTSSRPNSYTPSYMSNIQARPPDTPSDRSLADSASYRFHERIPSQIALKIPRRPINTSVKSPSPAQEKPPISGLLLIVFAAAPHPSTTFFLETLLARRSFSGIALVGSKPQEHAVKQLKIEIYSLIGKMHKEIGVYTYARDVWTTSDMQAVVKDAVKDSAAPGLHGVICSPEFDDSGTTGVDVIGLGEEALYQSWKGSVGFLHAASNAVIPGLQETAASLSTPAPSGPLQASHTPFFLVAGSSAFTTAAQISKPSCDVLIELLQKDVQPKGITVGLAEHLLVPERTVSRHSEKSQAAGDSGFTQPASSAYVYDDSAFTPSESPTKLWNMWAIQNDD